MEDEKGGVVPQELLDDEEVVGKFIKADEFEGDGQVLTVVSFERVKSNNPKFGANEKDALMQQGKLSEGETFRYTFKQNVDGFEMERLVESKSLALFIAFSQLNPSAGDTVRISKTGKMEDTRYTVESHGA